MEDSQLSDKLSNELSDELSNELSDELSNESSDELTDSDDNSDETYPIEVLQPLDDIIADEHTHVTFKCVFNSEKKYNVTWYKDGVVVKKDKSENESSTEQTFELALPFVSNYDYGMYSIYYGDRTNNIHLNARLYIRPMILFDNNRGYLYTDDCLNDRSIIRRHLINVTVKIGEEINFLLLLKNALDFNNTFEWYKSNKKIVGNDNKIIINDALSSKLTILKAQMSDTGIYQVVTRTKGGIVSSIAHAVVTDAVSNKGGNTIEEMFPSSTEIYINEELHLVCKAKIQANTIIQCTRNDSIIDENHELHKDIKYEDYGNGYFCMKIKEEYNGIYEYALEFIHPDGKIETTSNFVNYKNLPRDIQPVRVLQPLQSVAAYLGARILLKCRFNTEKNDHTHIVWRIRGLKVRRSNHRFNVICNGGECYLVIKRLEPDMVGLVTCELRQYVVRHRSVLVSSSTADLVAVPPTFFQTDLYTQTTIKRHIIYTTLSTDLNFSLFLDQDQGIDEFGLLNDNQDDSKIIQNNGLHYNTTLMTIECCRLQDDIFCYLDTSEERSEACCRTLKLIVESPETIESREGVYYSPKDVLLKWSASMIRTWYSIELFKLDGTYQEIRQSHAPMVELRNLVMERVVKLRIKAIPPLPRDVELSAIIREWPELSETRPKKIGLNTLRSYHKKYKDGNYIIGSGAFGVVALVEDSDGNRYAAKTVNMDDHSKHISAMREYNILKRLNHPNLVRLCGAFADTQKAIFVFKYYCAGSLFDRLAKAKRISEGDASIYVRQICNALQYLHNLNIVHMDIKPENIICVHQNSFDIKLIDFGLSHILDENGAIAKYGTKSYMPPEVLNGENMLLKSDMWSVGVLTYYLLSCVLPFANSNIDDDIKEATFDYNYSTFEKVSKKAKHFINHLLVVRPSKRMSARRALKHPWLNESNIFIQDKYTGRTLQELERYLEKNKVDQRSGDTAPIPAHQWNPRRRFRFTRGRTGYQLALTQ